MKIAASGRCLDRANGGGQGMKTMKAIVQDEYGTAPEDVLRLAEVARPAIGDDEILVRVAAASVDRGTWHLMAGLLTPCGLRASGSAGQGPQSRPQPGGDGRIHRQGRDRIRAGR